MPSLFDPLVAGELTLPNRIILAPMTRSRAGAGRVPTVPMRDYYVQRAKAGLMISEATSVSPMGVGYPATPGIWSEEQTAGWKMVTDAVHAAGGRMFLQLWHVGRMSDPVYLDGRLPVAPSALPPPGDVNILRPKRPYSVPRALEIAEIAEIIKDFAKAAENAKTAGFDGVEIHGGNGYLLEQFLVDSSNQRSDAYGGSIEKRARFMLEVTDAVIGVWGAGRVGMHLSPRGDGQSAPDSDPAATFGHIARQLGKRKIAFICSREYQDDGWLGPKLKAAFGGIYIANEKFNDDTAQALLANGDADAVAFGMSYLANPDLTHRFAAKSPLNVPDHSTFYGRPEKDANLGYTDYPALA